MEWLKAYLERLGKTGAEFARHIDVPRSRVYEMYRGDRRLQPQEVELAAPFLGMTRERLLDIIAGKIDPLQPEAPKSDVEYAPDAPERPYRGDWQVDVPVLGAAVGGDATAVGDFEMNGEPAFHAPRPPQLKGRKDVFAVIVRNTSMSPWKEPGSLVYVEGRKPPRNGEYVVIELKPSRSGDAHPALLKKLVAMTATKFRLLQYEPRKEFEIDRAKVNRIFRVLDQDELLGV